jgi:predicted ester cyclase
MDIQRKEIETKTGTAFEVKDSDGNMIGFADYSKQHSLGRSKNSAKSVVEEYAHRVWDDKDLKAIDDLVDSDAVIHSLLGDFHGPGSMKTVVQAWLKGFPDLNASNDHVICENDLVSIQWRANGTHLGEFKGRNPTKKTVSYDGATVYRIKDGKIVEY